MIMPKRGRKRWDSEVRREATAIIRSSYDNYHSWWLLTKVYALVALSIGIPYFLSFGNTIAWWLLYAIVSVPSIACWQRGLAEILHQSTHKTLAKNRTLNFIAGTCFSGYQVLQSWLSYSDSHGAHHRHLGNPRLDPDLKFQIERGRYEIASSLSFVVRVFLPCLLPFRLNKIRDLLVNRLWAKQKSKLGQSEQLLCLLTFLSTGLFFALIGYGSQWVLFWVVPLVTYFPSVNDFIETLEHYPGALRCVDELGMTRNRWTGRIAALLTGLLNENYHQTHHLFPECPGWAIPKLHVLLMRDQEYAESQKQELGLIFPVVNGVPSILENVISQQPTARSLDK